MKRRYKAGDWIRVPLGGGRDAVAIIARACRSRLFGYFFAVPATHSPSHDELRRLQADGAFAALLFGGAPIEQARWPVIATSLAFDPRAWTFPAFASRGAFGQSWQQIRYDPQTLQIVERTPVLAREADGLPDARFANAHEVEEMLRRRLAGARAPRAHGVYELRTPLDAQALHAIEDGSRVQFSMPLGEADVRTLSEFLRDRSGIELRVHGFRRGFDAAMLERCSTLQTLTLDVHRLQHADALRSLRDLRTLRLGAMQADLSFLDALERLERLELRGTRGALDPLLRLTALRALMLENTASVDLSALACAESLAELVLSHGSYDLGRLRALSRLQTLVLQSLEAGVLPDLGELRNLERLHLLAMRNLRDLTPITAAPALRELRVAAMSQLNVADFEPLQACADLRDLHVEIGSRSKEREIYRSMNRGSRG